MASNFSLSNKSRTRVTGIPFLQIKNTVLGPGYELSVALVSGPEATRITKQVKHKDKASNVLAFPLSKRSGEILLCPSTARKEAKSYGMTPKKFLTYLFIHGCLHLKGMDHGGTMEHTEQRLLASVPSFTHAKNRNRNRRRHVSR